MRKTLLLLCGLLVGCGGGGGNGGGGTPPPTGDQELQFAAPGEYGGTVDDWPTDRSCTLIVHPDPLDSTKPSGAVTLQIQSGSGGIGGTISGHALNVWGVNQFVNITKLSNGRIRIWGIKPGSGNEIAINVITPGPVINPPPPVP